MSALQENCAPLAVGDVIEGRDRVVDARRLSAYGDGLLSSAAGRIVQVQANIHTDAAEAARNGLPAPIADGMLSTNYLSSMLTRHFGRAYIENGELRTKFIKPIPVDTFLHVRGQVTERTQLADGAVRYVLDVWTETEDGVRMVVGDATVEVR
jgi:3-hydroxybutyryl-CoA dehydratase